MFGQNPKRSAVLGDGSTLDVVNIFKTIQGEGPLVGTPAIFIRLGGCNLACSFCDTEFENFSSVSVEDILKEVNALAGNSVKLAVVTGGEPLRQPIELLCNSLIESGMKVQIETNGTLFRKLPVGVEIVCSPKPSKNGYSAIRQDLLPFVTAIKFLVDKNSNHYNSLAEIGQTRYNIPVFIQPIDLNDDKLNKENTDFAMEIASSTGHRLSLQIHKILNIE